MLLFLYFVVLCAIAVIAVVNAPLFEGFPHHLVHLLLIEVNSMGEYSIERSSLSQKII